MSSAVTLETHRSLLSAIIAYLASLKQSPFAAELGTASDSLDAALDCLTEATGISLSAAVSSSSSPSLLALYTAAQTQSASSSPYPSDSDPRFQQFLKLLTDSGFFTGLTVGSAAYNERLAAARLRYSEKYPQTAASAPKAVSAEDRAAAEKLKNEGNSFLSAGKHQQAADRYSAAIALNPTSAIYFANRAAAFINLSQWGRGEEDSRAAIALDPQYGKAHYRLGQCLLSQHRPEEAVAAFERALQFTDASMKGTIEEQLQAARAMTAGGGGGAGGAGEEVLDSEDADGAGGLDFSSIMNNPMFAQVASQLAGGAGGAGGGIDFNAMLNNPQIMQMAASMFGGGGGGAGAGGSARTAAAPPASSASSSSPSASASRPPSSSSPSSDSIISSFLNSPAGAALASDPVMAPVIADVKANGPSALSAHMSNPAVVAKLNALAGPLLSSARQQGAAERQRAQGQ